MSQIMYIQYMLPPEKQTKKGIQKNYLIGNTFWNMAGV